MIVRRHRSAALHATHGFTLTELLVVMGVIAVLATLTVVGLRGVARNARMASATNAIMVALDSARALAMKENAIVLVAFRPRLEGPNQDKMVVETVVARWTGESYLAGTNTVIDRFVPIQGIPSRPLPEGIKVAGPAYRQSVSGEFRDDVWLTQSHLPLNDQVTPLTGTGEWSGALIGVMYAPDGSTITRNSQSDSDSAWVDFVVDPDPTVPPTLIRLGTPEFTLDVDGLFFEQWWADDEPLVTVVPFLAVYDDEEARELRTNDDWKDQAAYEGDLTGPDGYINLRTDRIHFNRYSGVAMK